MLDFSTFLRPNYWFDLTPAPLGLVTEYVFLAIFVLSVLIGLVVRFMKKRRINDRFVLRAFQSFSRMLITMGGLGLLLLFFSFEQIRLLGSRFWYPLWLIGLSVWLFLILRRYFTVAPKERVREELRRQKEKYLPRKKK